MKFGANVEVNLVVPCQKPQHHHQQEQQQVEMVHRKGETPSSRRGMTTHKK